MFGINETAQRIGRSPDTVRRWIKSGEIQAVQVGRKWMIREEEIERLTSGKSEKIISLFTKLTDAGFSTAETTKILFIVKGVL